MRCQQPVSARGCRSHQAACGLLPSPFGLGGGKERIQRSMESKLKRKVLLWANSRGCSSITGIHSSVPC